MVGYLVISFDDLSKLSITDSSVEGQFNFNISKCNVVYYYIYFYNNGTSDCYPYTSTGLSGSISSASTIYSNFNILDGNGNVIVPKNDAVSDSFELNLTVEPIELTTNVPILIHTQLFSETGIMKFDLEYSLNYQDWTSCDIRSINDKNGNAFFQFYYNAYKNEKIYFRLKNLETGEYIYDSVDISNIVTTQDNVNNYIDGVFNPTPFLSYEYISDTEILITTQKFFENEISKLKCSYGKDLKTEDLSNEEKWQGLEIRSFYDKLTKENTYQFYLNVNNEDGTGDGEYFFRFYNSDTKEYTYATMQVIFQNIVDYQQKINGIDDTLQKFIDFFKERFGFLTYPFELIINILSKINTIKFDEPKFFIPDINEPATGEKIISAVEFNFNDLLENEILKNVHDIYLIVVDAIIVFALVNLAKNKIMGVFEK